MPVYTKKKIISKSSNHENCKNVDQYTSVSFFYFVYPVMVSKEFPASYFVNYTYIST